MYFQFQMISNCTSISIGTVFLHNHWSHHHCDPSVTCFDRFFASPYVCFFCLFVSFITWVMQNILAKPLFTEPTEIILVIILLLFIRCHNLGLTLVIWVSLRISQYDLLHQWDSHSYHCTFTKWSNVNSKSTHSMSVQLDWVLFQNVKDCISIPQASCLISCQDHMWCCTYYYLRGGQVSRVHAWLTDIMWLCPEH